MSKMAVVYWSMTGNTQAMAEATAENEKSRRTQEETSQETEEPPEGDLDKTTPIDFGELQFGREYEIK